MVSDKEYSTLINKFTNELLQVAKYFEPRKVIYELFDLLSYEYMKLSGSEDFESSETNPLMGLRGASRYLADPDQLRFQLEVLRNVRNKERIKNVSLAIPFVRTISEFRNIKRSISASGFRRSTTFSIYLVAQVPSLLLRLERFIDVGADGIIIDLDDLAQYVFGSDSSNIMFRDSYPASHPAVLELVEKCIEVCNKKGIISIVRGTSLAENNTLIKKLVLLGVGGISSEYSKVNNIHKRVFNSEKSLITKK
jgi:pyruvate,water dikinase